VKRVQSHSFKGAERWPEATTGHAAVLQGYVLWDDRQQPVRLEQVLSHRRPSLAALGEGVEVDDRFAVDVLVGNAQWADATGTWT
jgi:hypothetical protein